MAEKVSLVDIAERVGTPVYVYSMQTLQDNFDAYKIALGGALPKDGFTICFAMKANGNLAVLKILAQLGSGADIVSGGELARAQAAGIPAHKIVFSGVGKTEEELAAALTANIFQINVESLSEAKKLSEVAQKLGTTARIALRINPDIDSGTHAKITTGKKENKFGIDIAHAEKCVDTIKSLPNIALQGIAIHIGSQLVTLNPFKTAFKHVAELIDILRTKGHEITTVDLGGGIGIAYNDEDPPQLDDYAKLIKNIFGGMGLHIIVEPGRSIAGTAGVLLSRVIYIKEGGARKFAIIDAAMNDHMRPALYEAYHPIIPVKQPGSNITEKYDIVGPVCETGDTFATQRACPTLKEGDLVAIGASGAYGAVMSGTYNARPLIPEVLASGEKFSVIRARPSLQDMLKDDKIPDWLSPDS